MFRIVSKKELTPALVRYEIEAPAVARKAQPGQFIILRADENGERIPITVHDYDREKGTVTIIVRLVGASSMKLSLKKEGEFIHDFVGPLGKPTEVPENVTKIAVIAGGVGAAIAYPVAKKFHDSGLRVDVYSGYRTKDVVVLTREFFEVSESLFLCTNDGSYARKAMVPQLLEEQIIAGAGYDAAFAVGPMVMMKEVCNVTKRHHLPTIVSMSPIMVDGTGMCGCCRINVNGEMRFACVDGPDFDGKLVDWDEAIARSNMYADWERKKYEEACNLLNIGGVPYA